MLVMTEQNLYSDIYNSSTNYYTTYLLNILQRKRLPNFLYILKLITLTVTLIKA